MRLSEGLVRALRGAAGAGLVIAAGCAGAAGDAAPGPSIVPVKHGAAVLIPMAVTVPAPLEVTLTSTVPAVDPGPPVESEPEAVDMRDEAAGRRKRQARTLASSYHHYAHACGRG